MNENTPTDDVPLNDFERELSLLILSAKYFGAAEATKQAGGRAVLIPVGYRGQLRSSARALWRMHHGRNPTPAELNDVLDH